MNPYLGNNAKKVKLLSYMISIFCVLCVASSVQVVKKDICTGEELSGIIAGLVLMGLVILLWRSGSQFSETGDGTRTSCTCSDKISDSEGISAEPEDRYGEKMHRDYGTEQTGRRTDLSGSDLSILWSKKQNDKRSCKYLRVLRTEDLTDVEFSHH